MTPTERIRATACLVALQHDDATETARAVLASALDVIADVVTDEALAWYLRGLSDGLRRRSAARRVRATEIN